MRDKWLIACGTISVAAGTLALVFGGHTGLLAAVLAWAFAGIAIAAFVALPLPWVRTRALAGGAVLGSLTPWRSSRPELPASAYTSRWRFTPTAFDVGTLANLSNKAFSHRSYMRQSDDKPAAVRIGTFVACSPLGEDEPTAEYLRAKLRDFLAQPALLSLVGKFTHIEQDARWQYQPGRGRFNLEADLVRLYVGATALASVLLLLPESGVRRYGKDQAGAELYLHIDIPMNGGVPVGVFRSVWAWRSGTADSSLPSRCPECSSDSWRASG